MGRPSGAHTHPPSGLPVAVVLVIGGLVLWAVTRGSPAVHKAGHAAGAVLHVMLISAAAGLALALAGAVVAAVVVVRRSRREPRQVERGYTATVTGNRRGYTTGEPPPALPEGYDPPSAALLPPPAAARVPDLPADGPREVHYHVHVHGAGEAEAVAQAMRDIAEGR